MFDDDFDEGEDSFEEDFYADIPDEAFYYEESAHKYGFKLGYKEDFEGVEKFNNEFDEEDEEDEWN